MRTARTGQQVCPRCYGGFMAGVRQPAWDPGGRGAEVCLKCYQQVIAEKIQRSQGRLRQPIWLLRLRSIPPALIVAYAVFTALCVWLLWSILQAHYWGATRNATGVFIIWLGLSWSALMRWSNPQGTTQGRWLIWRWLNSNRATAVGRDKKPGQWDVKVSFEDLQTYR